MTEVIIFAGTQTVWISDGCYSVHMMAASDMDTAVNENDRNESDEMQMQISGFCVSIIWWLLIITICFSPSQLDKTCIFFDPGFVNVLL